MHAATWAVPTRLGAAGEGEQTSCHQGKGKREYEDLHREPVERCLHPTCVEGGQMEAA